MEQDYNRLCFNTTTMSQIDEEEDCPPALLSEDALNLSSIIQIDASGIHPPFGSVKALDSSAGDSTPRSAACPPKKVKPAVPRKPLVVLDPNLEQTMWDESCILNTSALPSKPCGPSQAATPVLVHKAPRKSAGASGIAIPVPDLSTTEVHSKAVETKTEMAEVTFDGHRMHWDEQKSFLHHEIEVLATMAPCCHCEKFAAVLQEYKELVSNEQAGLNTPTQGRKSSGLASAHCAHIATQTPAAAGRERSTAGKDSDRTEVEFEMLLTENAMLTETKNRAEAQVEELANQLAKERQLSEEAKSLQCAQDEKQEEERTALAAALEESRLLRLKNEEDQAALSNISSAFAKEKNDWLSEREQLAKVASALREKLEQELAAAKHQLEETQSSVAVAPSQHNEEMSSKLAALEKQLEEERAERIIQVTRLTAENELLKAKAEQLAADVNECQSKFDEEKRALVVQIEGRVNAAMEDKDKFFQAELDRVETEHANKLEEQAKLHAGISEQLSALSTEQDEWLSAKQRLATTVEALEMRLTEEREATAKLVDELKAATEGRELLETQKRQVESELSSLTSELKGQTQELAVAESELKTQQQKHRTLEEERDRLANEVSQLNTKFQEAVSTRSEVEGNMAALQAEVNSLRHSLVTAEEKMDGLSTKLAQQRTEWVEAEEQLQREQSHLRVANDGIKEELAKMESQLKEESLARSESEAKAVSSIAEKEKLLSSNAKLDEELAAIKAQMEKEWDEFDRLENEFRTDNFELRKEVLKLKRELNLISEEEACAQLGYDLNQVHVNS